MRGATLAFHDQDRSHTYGVRDRPPQLRIDRKGLRLNRFFYLCFAIIAPPHPKAHCPPRRAPLSNPSRMIQGYPDRLREASTGNNSGGFGIPP
ncbi:hypothetical protein L6452_29653 [Arctium lappa]|uniref:Uncharacterized protein n=1 Tax=Arctium lappa TaxID=4217 RepID=A0ACB8ZH47_ARCLA|nr:hypothetical protein L6452_29653 [Arctium lappa]